MARWYPGVRMEAGLSNMGLHRRTCGPRRACGCAALTTDREAPISKAGGTLGHPAHDAGQLIAATRCIRMAYSAATAVGKGDTLGVDIALSARQRLQRTPYQFRALAVG